MNKITELVLRDPCRVRKMRRFLASEGYNISASDGFGLIISEKDGEILFYPHWAVLMLRGTTTTEPEPKAGKGGKR